MKIDGFFSSLKLKFKIPEIYWFIYSYNWIWMNDNIHFHFTRFDNRQI